MKANTVEQHQLTENIIKKVALRFMRQYYKFRLRYEDQPVVASYDLEGVGGIIADGYYSFKKTDGRTFTATFEATSKESKDEVVFKPQMRILFWDGLAVASIITLALAAINYFKDLQLLDERTILIRILLIMASLVISMLIFYLIAKNFRRYRYIYAVEQFKKYHADEQWIALADDVFLGSNNKHFRELKYQCIHNGFGIVQVNQNLDTKILVTPSRQDIFVGKRKEVDFMPQQIAQQQKSVQKFDAKWALTQSWLPSFMKNQDAILRFRRSYNTQIAVILACFFLIGFLFMKELELSGYQIVDREEFRNDIAISQSNEVREQPEYLGDSLLTEHHTNPDIEEFNRSIWRSPKTIAAQKTLQDQTPKPLPSPPVTKPVPPPTKKDTTQIVVSQNKNEVLAYDCSRYFTFETYKYVVEENSYKNWPAAERRLALIRNSSIPSAALSKNCFFPGETGFIIYLGEIYNSPEEASQYIEELNSSSQTVIKNVRQLKITKLRPPVGR
ncbi:MAG: hypothetical protein R2788_10925 [Saprospiraceae bacterium]